MKSLIVSAGGPGARSIIAILVFVLSVGSIEAQTVDSFIPKGFGVLDQRSGDLDGDGDTDLILIAESLSDKASESVRPILVLLKANGGYTLAARNDSVVLCKTCGGMMGDPYQGIVIRKNYFSIEHYGGSSWRWERIITFRFDRSTKTFVLHRDAGTSFHASEPDKTKNEKYQVNGWGKTRLVDYSNAKW